MAAFKELEGKRVFITGAASGIGYEMALAFAREGADIIAADLQQEGLAELAPKIEAIGLKCRQVTLDVTDEAAYANLFSDLIADGEMPDIVINTAIVKHPELTRVPAEQLARLQAFYAANGDTPASVAQAVVAGVKSGSGTVFAGSGVGMTGLLKRLLSRFRFRRLLISKAREIGYL